MTRQREDRPKTPRRNRTILATLIAVGYAASACSGGAKAGNITAGVSNTTAANGASAASDCVAKATDFLKAYDGVPTKLPASFTPLSKAPKPGGTIIKIVNGKIPSDGATFAETTLAAVAIGWTAKEIVQDGTVEDINAKWEEAIAQKPTAIVGAGNPASVLQRPIADAKSGGIIVGLSNVTDTAVSNPGLAAVASGTPVNQLFGRVHANLVMRGSQCKTNVAIFALPFPIFKVETDSFRAALASACPDCKSSYHEIQAADIGSPAATNAVISALQADPSIKYVFTPTAALANGVPTALSQANITGVKVFGQSPNDNSIKLLHDGTASWWLNVGAPINGWQEVDAVVRAIDTGGPVTTTEVPLSILTPANVGKDTTTPPVYPTNFRELYKQAWGVG
jgi:ABC-type sugar transport system substrate-binding protein